MKKVKNLSIREYIDALGIEKNRTLSNAEKKVKLLRILAPGSSPEALGLTTLNQLYEKIEAQFTELKNAKPVYYIRIGAVWYQVDVFYRELSAGQYIDLMAVNSKDDSELADNLDRIMAILCRRCRFLWFFPERYNTKTFDERRALMLTRCKIGEVMGVVNFFLQSWTELSYHIATFLAEERIETMKKELERMTK